MKKLHFYPKIHYTTIHKHHPKEKIKKLEKNFGKNFERE